MSLFPKFDDLVQRICKQQERIRFLNNFIAIDPGETTGLAYFSDAKLVRTEQVDTKKLDYDTCIYIKNCITSFNPAIIVMEEYRIFSWRSKQHSWSHLHTSQLIGFITGTCALKQIPVHMQTPQNAKGFVTNDKLKDWNMYVKGQTHSRDAIRHGCFYLLFGPTGRKGSKT